MITLDIPGFGDIRVEHLVLDFNGTLAQDGMLLPGVRQRIARVAADLQVHVVTADTFGRAAEALAGLALQLTVLTSGDQAGAKLDYVRALTAERVVAIGNGRNDRLMLAAARLGIAVMQAEGAAVDALLAARIAVPDIAAALGLLLNPGRLIATLRV